MGDALVIRRANSSDSEEIYEVMRRSRRSAFAGLLPADALDWSTDVSEDFHEFVRKTVSDDASALLVAVSERTVVGLAELAWNSTETRAFVGDAEAELNAIHVHPDHWNEGIGTTLLGEVVATLPSRVSALALRVLSGNDRARAFYERRGFEQDGTTVTTVGGEEHVEVVYRRSLRDGE